MSVKLKKTYLIRCERCGVRMGISTQESVDILCEACEDLADERVAFIDQDDKTDFED